VVVLRATRKVLKSLSPNAGDSEASDNALGDWYINRIVVDRKPLLLLVSAKSLLAIIAPARHVKDLPKILPKLVEARLRRLPIDEAIVAAEVAATGPVHVGKTLDRSVTGQLVDFAKALPMYLPVDSWDESTLRSVEERFEETPCRASRAHTEVIWPARSSIQLLRAAWPASSTKH
jgi:hypothetical protein